MRTITMVAVALLSAGCADRGLCVGGGVRVDGLCACPDGTEVVNNECMPASNGGSDANTRNDGAVHESLDGESPVDARVDTASDAASNAAQGDGGSANAGDQGDGGSADAGDQGDGGSASQFTDATFGVDANSALDGGCSRLWYADCDGDGYAADKAGVLACGEPSTGACVAWLETPPQSGVTTDCNDTNVTYRPGASFGPIGAGDGDLNCDKTVERSRKFVAQFADAPPPDGVAMCADGTTCNCYTPNARYPGMVGLSVNNEPVDFQGVVIPKESLLGRNGESCARGARDVVAFEYLVPGFRDSCVPQYSSGGIDLYYFLIYCR